MPHKGKRAQTQLNMEKLGVILINGSVTISDPCYEPHIWCAAVMNVLPGQWVCQAEKVSDTCVKTLRICKPGCEKKVKPDERWCTVSVESGKCGFFDTETYEKIYASQDKADAWYKETNRIALDKACGLMSDSFGVVSISYNGDGVFPVYVGRDNHGDIVSIEIRFIG